MKEKTKTAKEIFGEDTSICDYEPILESFGEILLQVDDHDYSGDSRVLYRSFDGEKYGFLVFGWGSCSGCDALQGCRNIEEVQELMDSFQSCVKWFYSLEELQTYFKGKDWPLEWSYDCKETKQFIEQVIQYQS